MRGGDKPSILSEQSHSYRRSRVALKEIATIVMRGRGEKGRRYSTAQISRSRILTSRTRSPKAKCGLRGVVVSCEGTFRHPAFLTAEVSHNTQWVIVVL